VILLIANPNRTGWCHPMGMVLPYDTTISLFPPENIYCCVSAEIPTNVIGLQKSGVMLH